MSGTVPTSESLWVRHEDDLPDEGWADERGTLSWRTLFSAESTPTSQMVSGVSTLAEGGSLAPHRHDQTEIYYVLTGNGTVVLAGQEHRVGAGTAVFIPGGLEHGIRNDEPTEILRFFYVLAADRFADVGYRFS